MDWPSDLCFELVPNPALRTFDGLALDGGAVSAARSRYTTGPMTMQLSYVTSELALNATGGQWDSALLAENDDAQECPPDGVVYLSFSSEIDHGLAFKALRDANPTLLGSEESAKFDDCGSRCLAVRPRGLAPGSRGQLIFPAGKVYSKFAGSAGAAQTVTLVGLVPFTFPFWFATPPAEQWQNRLLRYRRHRLYLRHGLAPGSTERQLKALTAAFSLRDPSGVDLNFTLKLLDKATLQLDCPHLVPNTRYSLSVSASDDVRDGFGQALQACGIIFDTADWPDSFVDASESPAYFRDAPATWQVLAGGDGNSWCSPMGSKDCTARPFELSAWPVKGEAIVPALLQRFQPESTALSHVKGFTVRAPTSKELQVVGIEAGKLLGGSKGDFRGLFLRQTLRSDYIGSATKGFVSVAQFGAALVGTPTNQLLVWATEFGGGPVKGASVTVYRVPQGYGQTLGTEISVAATGQTDDKGMALLEPANKEAWRLPNQWGTQLVAIVKQSEDSIVICEQVPEPWTAPGQPLYSATMITDRAVYRPGDIVYVKGYIRAMSPFGVNYTLPTIGEGTTLAVDVKWNSGPSSDRSSTHRTQATFVNKYGSFSANFTVPSGEDEVSYGDIPVQLLVIEGQFQEAVVATETFVVADPRPPTVTLKLSTPAKVVLPGAAASIDVDVQTATYSGVDVEGAEVELTWTLSRRPTGTSPDGGVQAVQGLQSLPSAKASFTAAVLPRWTMPSMSPQEQQTGKLTVVTAAGGKTTAKLDLAKLLQTSGDNGAAAPPAEEGDSLSVSARWVGPTREVVNAELEGGDVKVGRSKYTLALTPTRAVNLDAGLPLPGTPFALYIDIRDEKGTSVDGTEVEVSLHEWDGDAPIRSVEAPHGAQSLDASSVRRMALRPPLLPPESWGKRVGTICKASADGGKNPQCGDTVALPRAAKFVVLAKATDPDGIELVTGFAVGKTPKEWDERPLSALDDAVTIQTDKPKYEVGDIAKLFVTSPFENAEVMVVWGNAPSVQTLQQTFKQSLGQQETIEIQVGDSCRFGCKVLVVLVAPNQKMKTMLPVEVPVSPLLDLTLPRSIAKTVTLNVPDRSREFLKDGLQISVVAAEGGAPSKVFEPGASTKVRLSVPSAEAGAEVCLFVTDKAMLDVGVPLHPHALVELHQRFEQQRGDDFRSEDTRHGLASARGYDETSAAALRRAALDPWAVEDTWPLQPSPYSPAPVEQTDEQYFAARTDDLTRFPSSRSTPVLLGSANHFMFRAPEAMPMAMMAKGLEVEMDMAAPAAGVAETTALRGPAPVPPAMEKANKFVSADGGAGGGGSTGSLGKAVYARSKFQATPLFAPSVIINANGEAEVELRLPDQIATFEVRAYVVDGRGATQFAQASTTIISRREVSMVPSVPRIAHIGDRFECGVSVTRPGDGASDRALDIFAEVQQNDTILGFRKADLGSFAATTEASAGPWSSPSVVKVPLAAGGGAGPLEVIFPFEAVSVDRGGAVGLANLKFTASFISSGRSQILDVLEVPLPVKLPQGQVSVGSSFVIAASPTEMRTWPEGLDLPNAVPGSGAVTVNAGVGHLPTVLLHASDASKLPLDDAQTVAVQLLYGASLRLYFKPSARLEGAAVGLDVVAGRFAAAIRRLPSFTDDSLGLVWRPEERWPWQRPSISTNAFGLLVAQVVSQFAAGAPAGNAEGAASDHGSWSTFVPVVPEDLPGKWRAALERELQQVSQDRRNTQPPCQRDCFQDWDTIAEVRASLGFRWSHYEANADHDFSMDRLFSDTSLRSLSTKGLAHAGLAYTLYAPINQLPGEARPRLDVLYGKLANRIRVQGATAYIAGSENSQYSAGLSANAAALLLLACAGRAALAEHFAGDTGSSIVAKLAAYVAAGGGRDNIPFGGGTWVTVEEAGFASASLAAYDLAMGMTSPDLVMEATSGNVKLLEYEARGPGAAPASRSTRWEALSRPPAPIQFTSRGTGEVSLVASLTFVPAKLPTEGAVYRGIFVQKVVQQMDARGNPFGPALKVVPLGSSVVVTIQVTTPDELTRVTLQDYVCAGLEPVDASIAGDSKGSQVDNGCGWGTWWCFPSFYQLSVRPDRVAWSSQSQLQPGTHTVRYQATAATRGVFTLPAAHAYVHDQPELMGLSQASTLVVVGPNPNMAKSDSKLAMMTPPDPADRKAVEHFLTGLGVRAGEEVLPRGCPGGCPNGGVCQLSSGTCACYVRAVLKEGDCPKKPLGMRIEVTWRGGLGSEVPTDSSPSHLAVGVAGTVSLLAVAACLHSRKPWRAARKFDHQLDMDETPYSSGLHEAEMSTLVGPRRASPYS